METLSKWESIIAGGLNGFNKTLTMAKFYINEYIFFEPIYNLIHFHGFVLQSISILSTLLTIYLVTKVASIILWQINSCVKGWKVKYIHTYIMHQTLIHTSCGTSLSLLPSSSVPDESLLPESYTYRYIHMNTILSFAITFNWPQPLYCNLQPLYCHLYQFSYFRPPLLCCHQDHSIYKRNVTIISDM